MFSKSEVESIAKQVEQFVNDMKKRCQQSDKPGAQILYQRFLDFKRTAAARERQVDPESVAVSMFILQAANEIEDLFYTHFGCHPK